MKHQLIKSHQLQTAQWAGGTTTQLYIYPKDASYIERNFDFRISTATVESEKSEFTKLPGVKRKLMILDGNIRIEHTGHHAAELNAFEQDEFFGGWDTVSYGQVTDFNLMCTQSCDGKLLPYQISEPIQIMLSSRQFFYGFYLCKGELTINLSGSELRLLPGDFLAVFPENEELKLKIYPDDISSLVEASVETI